MLKRFIAVLVIMMFGAATFAQDVTGNNSGVSGVAKPSRDFLLVQLGYNNWAGNTDSLKLKSIGYVFNAFLCYDFPIKKSSFSFATGLGINVNVVYFNNQRLILNDTSISKGGAAYVVKDSGFAYSYKRFKFVTTYLTAPFELRYFSNKINRNRGFKASIGADVGLFLGAHTKGVASVGGVMVKDKVDTKRYMATWSLTPKVRIGYGNYSLFASYAATNVFQTGEGPVVTPYTIGFCLSVL